MLGPRSGRMFRNSIKLSSQSQTPSNNACGWLSVYTRGGSLSYLRAVVNSTVVNMHTPPSPLAADSSLSDSWRSALRARLRDGEALHGALELDLDASLSYAKRLILITNLRLL